MRSRTFLIFFIVLSLWFAFSHSLASAQIVKSMSPEAATNPKADPFDYIIPLPCNLSMAFRVIFIPEKGYLGEIFTYFGSDQDSEAVEGQNFINRKHKGYVGSALSIENLPVAFQEKAWTLKRELSDDNDGRQLYLFGKYEVTNAQYQAVMKNHCDLDQNSAQPVVNVSWYEAMDFTAKLMEYLLANAPDSLPRNQDDTRNVGLLRLPTEEEWEYAARGGHYVSQDDLSGEEFFTMERERTVKNYGLFNDERTSPQRTPGRIGTYLANPAGIYDTIGNASELIFEAFQMTLGSRLHGSAGGVISKGGSFRNVLKDVTPGARAEFAFFFESGPAKSADLGFRVLISSVNLASLERLEQIALEYNDATKTDTTLVENDPLKLVDELIRGSENPKDRRAYEALRSSIRDFNFSANEQRKLSARSYVWSLVYGVMGIRANGVRIEVTKKFIDIAQNTINDINKYIKDKNTNAETRKSLESKLPTFKQSLSGFEHKLEELNYSYEKQREHYNKLLLDGRDYPSELLTEQLAMVRQDIKGDDRFSVELSQCFMTAQKNLELVVSKKGNPTTIKRVELENYPKD